MSGVSNNIACFRQSLTIQLDLVVVIIGRYDHHIRDDDYSIADFQAQRAQHKERRRDAKNRARQNSRAELSGAK